MITTALNKITFIIGLGKTGCSCARFLQARNHVFVMMDTRSHPVMLNDFQREFPDVQVICGELDNELLLTAAEIIVSPGIDCSDPALQMARKHGIAVIGDVELFARHTTKPVIAITGSNAKSTVTTLVGEMGKASGLRVAVAGNIGIPVLDVLNDNDVDCYVLELSSFQLETTFSLKPLVGLLLNVSEDHMDRYDSLASYAAVKQGVFQGAENQVFNRRDALTWPTASSSSQGTQWSFGLDAPADHAVGISGKQDDAVFAIGNAGSLMPVNDVLLPGRHNLENIAAAWAVVLAANWPVSDCVNAVSRFTGLPHRCEWVNDIDGVRFYNDSKGTNVGATVAAIAGLASANKNIVLIAGGDGKGADFTMLADSIYQHVKHMVLIGRDANRIAEACHLSAATFASSMQLAVQRAAEIAEAGDVVLLSPACASFDMFTGYDDRGRQFCQAVELLA